LEYTLAAVNLKSVNMCAGFYDRVCEQFPGVNQGNAEDISDSRHTQVDKLKESMDPDGIKSDLTQDGKGHIGPISDIRIAFNIDDKSGRITIKVIDNLTNEVIRYVPPEDLMSVMSWLCEFQDILAGLVIDEMR
jgi:hypothetical protein